MRIEVEILHDQFKKEVWTFIAFDLHIVFTGFSVLEKPKEKRKWQVISKWDKYARSSENTCDEPNLPDFVKELALKKYVEMIQVNTWSEWKSKQR